MRRLRLATGVEEEIRASARWYEDQHPGLGSEFEQEVEATLEDVAKAPASHPRVGAGAGELTFRQAFMRRFPYKVIFLERPDEIMILACAHSRQRPGYWRRRLPK